MTNRILFATLAFAAACPASAQDQPEVERSRDVSFHVIDANDDGRISKAEAATNDTLGRTFAVADRDRDGFIDTLEYHQHIRELRDTRHHHPANPDRD